MIQEGKYLALRQSGHDRAHSNGYVYQHILVAEKALGKALPPEAVVHHVNEDKHDNTNLNLVICQDVKYHRLLHARMRVLDAGGDPNTDKICSTCKKVKSKRSFHRSERTYDSLRTECKDCRKKEAKDRWQNTLSYRKLYKPL